VFRDRGTQTERGNRLWANYLGRSSEPLPAPAQGRAAVMSTTAIGSTDATADARQDGWLLQEITTRLPGRVTGDTTYASVEDLAEALQRAEAAHGEHEKRTGERDTNWPAWYASYMVAEHAGEELPV
jgi:hypothetical protein